MPLVETLPVGNDCAQWSVWGTTARIVVTDPAALAEAEVVVRDQLAAVDAACNRFRPDAEMVLAAHAGGRPVEVSPLLADLVGTALRAAAETGGDVDPTVGAALVGLGYDRDFAGLRAPRPAAVQAREFAGAAVAVVDGRLVVLPATADWRRVTLADGRLTVPVGTLLDLGATAKARTADLAAAAVAARCGTGVLVSLGGDIATAGPSPDGGWRVRVQDGPGEPACLITLPAGAALATSSTSSRRWQTAGEMVHHIVDPRTGRPARRVWRTASVAAFSCVRANTLATAAIVRGKRARGWLTKLGAPARLVDARGSVLRLGGWPAETGS
jgi:thiamine biosynthesis lipoprotein